MIKLLAKFYYNLLLRMKKIFRIIIYFRKIYFSLFSNNLSLFNSYLNYILSLFHLSLDIINILKLSIPSIFNRI